MPIYRKPDLSLSGIKLETSIILYDDVNALDGNHLRWNFNPELGFPKNGFTLSRAVWNPQLPLPTQVGRSGTSSLRFDWSIDIKLPTSASDALNRIRGTFTTSVLNNRFGMAANELLQVIQQLRSTLGSDYLKFIDPANESGLTGKLRIMDVILLACVDPYLARMVGIYYIDNTAISTTSYVYLLTGHWADAKLPLISINFENLVIPTEYQTLQFGAVKIISSGRPIGVPTLDGNDLMSKHLFVHGEMNPAISIHFDFPVEEVILQYNLNDRDGAIVRTPAWGIRADGTVITPTASEGTRLHIQRPGHAFQKLEFTQVQGALWFIFKIEYRKKFGAIGDLQAYFLQTPAINAPVTVPSIARLATEQMPAMLNESGKIDNQLSQVNVSANLLEPELEEIDSDSTTDVSLRLSYLVAPRGRPVRLLFGTSASSTVAIPTGVISLKDEILYPSLYRTHASSAVLPELIGFWPLNGTYNNTKDGVLPLLLGNPAFTKEHFNNSDRFSLSLCGKDAIVLSGQEHLKAIGSHVTFEVSVKINPSNGSITTLIGNNGMAGFWMGLVKQSDGNYRVRFTINNVVHNASSSIPPATWIRLSASYNGSEVRFNYFGYSFSSSENALPAVLGELQTPAGSITLGADNGSTSTALIQPYRGLMADACIWQRVIHPSESAALLEKHGNFLSQQQSTAELIFHDPMCYEVSVSREPVLLQQTPGLKALGKSFSIFLFVRPLATNETFTTLLGNNYNERFWLGLHKSGTTFVVRIWLNRVLFQSTGTVPANSWSHVGMSYDGATLKIFINGRQDVSHAAVLGALNRNTLPIGVGSDTATSVVSGQYRHNGLIQGIQFWRKAINITDWKEKVSAIQHIHKYIKNGSYAYYAKGIDLFGRTSAWSIPEEINAQATPSFQPPVNVHGSFKPISGVITLVEEGEDHFVFDTDIPYNAAIVSRVIGYDVMVARMRPVPENRVEQLFEIDQYNNATGNVRLRVKKLPFSQLLPDIGDKIKIQFDFSFHVSWGFTGIQQLYFPELHSFRLYELKGYLNEIVGNVASVTSHSDYRHTITYAGRLSIIENELVGEKCLIGPNMFTIFSHGTGNNPPFTLHYSGMPAVIPTVNDTIRITLTTGHSTFKNYQDIRHWLNSVDIPIGNIEPIITNVSQTPVVESLAAVTPEELKTDPPINSSVSERQRLLLEKIDWLPLSQIYKIKVASLQQPHGYVATPPGGYIPGALVFWDRQGGKNRWRAFYVLWHQWETDGHIDLYVTPGEKNEELPVIDINAEHTMRLYLGKRYTYEGTLSSVPDLEGLPTLSYHLALTSRDGGGIESGLSPKATLVAVNRKRPGIGPRPEARILRKADYYDTCPVEITWPSSGTNVLYKLYRANDSAIYTRDLELRRTRQAYYNRLTPAEIFQDDPDFDDWLVTIDSALSSSDLFAESGSNAWNDLTPIWRKWADRFYPALTNEELDAIGMRPGNEKAFALITAKPLTALIYTDLINGVVRNRYYYRLRLITDALAESSLWGPLSEAVVPLVVMPPRKPVFSKIVSGDRQLIVQWALNKEPNLKEYILYRAETKEALEDLRWWRTDADPRIISRITDPLVKTLDRSLSLPATIPLANIEGVYALNEFDGTASPLMAQAHALNYYRAAPTVASEPLSAFIPSTDGSTPHRIINLRRTADGVAMAVVYADENGEIHACMFTHNLLPHLDSGLTGLKSYYYRLIAVNESGLKATSNEIKSAMALDNTVPAPPVWLESGWVNVSPSGDILPLHGGSGTPAVHLRWEVLPSNIREVKVERLNDLGSWENLSGWQSTGILSFLHTNPNSEKDHRYRLVVITFGNNQNKVFNERVVDKLLLPTS